MIISTSRKPVESVVYKTYWEFAKKRQDIFFARFNGEKDLTSDRILSEYKFTNAYRASDRVSQYLIKNVIYKYNQDPKEILFRILLFKTFNKVSTWEHLINQLGELSFKSYNFNKYDTVLTALMNSGIPIYSGAYIMTTGKSFSGHSKKHRNHLMLIDYMLKDDLPEKVINCKSLKDLFILLLKYPTIGTFLAYQYSVDINYSELVDFDEMDFVFPGPGAKDGIKKCFTDDAGYNESDIIRYVADRQEFEFERNNLNFKKLWGRRLQLIDIQNLFCEVDKYSRLAHPEIKGISGRTRIKQKYKVNKEQIDFWYPPKWKINKKINMNGGQAT